jgi:intracellular multiplication protein IcmQ
MTFSLSNAARDIKSDALKKTLLDAVKQENVNFSEIAESFYAGPAQTDADHLATLNDLIEMVDRLLEAGDWDDSLFLHNTVKPLKVLREQAQQTIDFIQYGNQQASNEVLSLATDMTMVYISLYQGQGDDLQRWEMQLRSLPRYILGRPIYETEEGVQKLIRLKTVKTCEAYVKVAIAKSATQQDGLVLKRTDRHGTALVNLMPGAVKTQNILEFVCQGKRYYWREGKLSLYEDK